MLTGQDGRRDFITVGVDLQDRWGVEKRAAGEETNWEGCHVSR